MLHGKPLESAGKKQLQQFKWVDQLAGAFKDPKLQYWMMQEGFQRLRRIHNRTLTIQIPARDQEEPHEFDAVIAEIFSRDLSQALLFDTHINQPDDIWSTPRDPVPGSWMSRGNFMMGLTSRDDLSHTENQELKLVALLTEARIGEMSDPAKWSYR
jgi:hypothetical protein